MKKQLHTSVLTFLACAGSVGLSAQAINETFAPNPQSIFSNGWAQQNLSTPIGTNPNWFNGNATVFAANSAPDSSYIAANYNAVAGANTISMWLFAPNRTFNNGDIISFYTRTVDTPTYPDRLELRLSTNGASVNAGATNTSVGDFTTLLLTVNSGLTTAGYPNVWTQYTATISGLAGPTSGRVAFRYFVTNGGPSGANSDFIGIDNFVYTPAGTPNVAVSPYVEEYTMIPLPQVTAFSLDNNITNGGSATANSAMLTVNVYESPNFITPIQTTTSATQTLLAAASASFNAGTFLPVDTGFFVLEFVSSCTNNQIDASDTSYYSVLITDTTYARDDGTITAALGIGAGNGGYLGNSFEIVTPTRLTSVTGAFTVGYPGEPYAFVVWDMAAGVPNAIIGSTDTLTYLDTNLLVTTVNMSGGPLTLMPGIYTVTAVEFDSTLQLAQTNTIFTTGTTWVNWPTSPAGGWANNEFFGVPSFNKPYVVRPNLNCNSTATQSVTLCSGQTITVGVNTYSATGVYTDTIANAFGCDSIVTTNLTVNAAIDVTTTTATYVITANQNGATYQWIDCNNGNAPIVGETNQSYTATQDGSYAVIVTVGSCSDTSACEVIIGMGISSASSEGAVSMYPNPNNGSFVVSSMVDGQFTIVNAVGQEIMKFELNQANNYRVNVNNLSAGVYIMSGYSNGKFVSQRFVVNEK
jgi:hypothetical protein